MDIFIIKEELTNNLCLGIACHVVDGFTSIYEDAVRANPTHVYEQVKRFLLDIQNWGSDIVTAETRRILSHFPTLRKVLKSINYINIKSLSLMGRHNVVIDDEYISRHTLSVRKFVHSLYIYSSKEFFHDETLLNMSSPGTRPRQLAIVNGVIKQLLNESVPLNDLLHNVSDDDEDSIVAQPHPSQPLGGSLILPPLPTTLSTVDEPEPEPITVKMQESGAVSNSGTGVQILLHSTIADKAAAAADDTTDQPKTATAAPEDDDEDDDENDKAEETVAATETGGMFEMSTELEDSFLTGGKSTVSRASKRPIRRKRERSSH